MTTMKELIDYDPATGLRTYFISDDDTQFHIHYEQDVSKILDENKRRQNDPTLRSDGYKIGWHHTANIPDIVILEWRTKYGVDIFNPDHAKAVKRLLMSPDYAHCRTTTGAY